jgi:hypothetical protein
MPARTKKRAMTDEHKSALAEGRNQSKTVGRYLEALEANKPKRGRKRTSDSVKKRLAAVETELKAANGLQRLTLLRSGATSKSSSRACRRAPDLSRSRRIS